jgi:uncharacterized Zn finger protein
MGWYYDYKPYVSVAQRRANAMRQMAQRSKNGLPVAPVSIEGRAIAKSFWGKAWCDNLESYSDFENRLPRGRTYVRNGSVVHLEIERGKITAFVAGSELYEVEITISILADPRWKRVKSQCAGQIGSLVELLQGRLSKSVMEVVTHHDDGLFPEPDDIDMRCSCPDSAGMCKHIAAVMYGIGARLDEQPELLFVLRKVDHLELIAGAIEAPTVGKPGAKGRKKTIAAEALGDVFGIEMAEAETPADTQPPVAKTPSKPRAVAAKAMAMGGSKATAKRAADTPKKPRRASAANQANAKTPGARAKAAKTAIAKRAARTRVKSEAK